MKIAREEIFGPVLSIMSYDTEDEAIEIANDTPFGLAGLVQSSEIRRTRTVANRIRAGRVYLNGAPFDRSLPFGGYNGPATGVSSGCSDLKNISRSRPSSAGGTSGIAVRFPCWRSRVACRAVAREQRARLRQVGFGAAAFTRFASEGWWARQDSNLQPDRYERSTLAGISNKISVSRSRSFTSMRVCCSR
jgi:delta 1-pyrroline-5-carboxylate dehydrogenase